MRSERATVRSRFRNRTMFGMALLVSMSIVAAMSTVGESFQPEAQAAEGAALTIDVYTCPAGFEEIETSSDPERACGLPTEDILFSLTGDTSEVAASTGEGGNPSTIGFGGLSAGSYVLTEAIPAWVSRAFVWECTSSVRSLENPLFSPFARPDEEGRLRIFLEPGEDVSCSWFNVLQPSSTRATLSPSPIS